MQKKYYLYQMSEVALNVVAVIIFIVMVLITDLFLGDKGIVWTDITYLLVIILMFPYMMLHEVIHSISYVLNGADFKNVTYGMHLEKGVFCCLCKQNITKRNILISLLFPFAIIGVITYIIGIAFNNITLIILSIVNISGCAGDLLMFFDLLRLKDFEYSEYDNPIAFGLYSANDLSGLKLLGLKYIGEEEQLERNDRKKMVISKVSIAISIVYVIACVVMVLLRMN